MSQLFLGMHRARNNALVHSGSAITIGVFVLVQGAACGRSKNLTMVQTLDSGIADSAAMDASQPLDRSPWCEGASLCRGSIEHAPTSRSGFGSAPTRTGVAVWGGYGLEQNIYQTLQSGASFDVGSNEWNTWNPSPTLGVHRASVGVIGEVAYTFGGCSLDSCGSAGLYRVDPNTGTSTLIEAPNEPSGRWSHSSAVVGGRLFIWGGDSGRRHENTGGVFDPVASRWTSLPQQGAPIPADDISAESTGNGKVLLWGSGFSKEPVSRLNEYDVTEGGWRSLSDVGGPPSRVGDRSTWHLGRMWLVGGLPAADARAAVSSYDPEEQQWQTFAGPDGYVPRSSVALTTYARYLIIYGGNAGDPVSDAWAFDTSNGTWDLLIPEGVSAFQGAVVAHMVGDDLVVIGEETTGYLTALVVDLRHRLELK